MTAGYHFGKPWKIHIALGFSTFHLQLSELTVDTPIPHDLEARYPAALDPTNTTAGIGGTRFLVNGWWKLPWKIKPRDLHLMNLKNKDEYEQERSERYIHGFFAFRIHCQFACGQGYKSQECGPPMVIVIEIDLISQTSHTSTLTTCLSLFKIIVETKSVRSLKLFTGCGLVCRLCT